LCSPIARERSTKMPKQEIWDALYTRRLRRFWKWLRILAE
jgi:hypothetical protein